MRSKSHFIVQKAQCSHTIPNINFLMLRLITLSFIEFNASLHKLVNICKTPTINRIH